MEGERQKDELGVRDVSLRYEARLRGKVFKIHLTISLRATVSHGISYVNVRSRAKPMHSGCCLSKMIQRGGIRHERPAPGRLHSRLVVTVPDALHMAQRAFRRHHSRSKPARHRRPVVLKALRAARLGNAGPDPVRASPMRI